MEAALKRRLELLITLLVVGVVAGAAIVALGAEKAIPGASNEYISVVKPPQTSQSPEQAQQQAQYEARVKSLLSIAMNDDHVHAYVAGKNYTVVGILSAPPASPGAPPIDSLVLRVEGKFYKINIDILHEKVISVEERICYGPACND
jgi:glutathione S-transferase